MSDLRLVHAGSPVRVRRKTTRRFHADDGWTLGIQADRISKDRWVVEWGDGDAMGGSSNSVRIMSDKEFQEQIVDKYREVS